jgi:hypothetical protein
MKRMPPAFVSLVAPTAPIPPNGEFPVPLIENMPGFRPFFDANSRRACNELEGLR